MRGFLTLCLIAVASAGKLGYNYAPNGGASLGGGSLGGGSLGGGSLGGGSSGGFSSGGLSSGGSFSSGGGLSSGVLSSGGSYSNGGGYTSGGLSSGGGSGTYSSGGGGGGFSSGGGSSGGFSAPAQTITELNKEFYLYSAPEEQVQAGGNHQSSTTTLKKNLRVIFIKAPENSGVTNAALQVAKQISEDQTAIYVLTKENDVSEISNQLQQISEVHSQKPEVRFVKYRTAQDAINAQRAIQAQYDSLGGSTKSSNEGVAPVLNYASSAPVSNFQGSASQNSGSIAGGAVASSAPSGSYVSPQKSYLPPVVL